ncbi:STAS domain-containing protein [Streptomyces sp. NPDC006285]|uniref:STAS domain-containing protein n=1 Tax=Streptomyces sp. NPDC006285 TaxID=3364742 RepID=UPI00367EDC0E
MTTIHKPSPQDRLSIEHHTHDGGIRVVSVKGELDADTCPLLEAALRPEDGPQPPHVVVDLSGVPFMDSSGITLFTVAYRTLTNTGGWLRIAAPTTPVQRVLNIVGLDTVIDCHPTLDDALTA